MRTLRFGDFATLTGLLAFCLLFSLDLSSQERPDAARARQAYHIDVDSQFSSPINAAEAQKHLHELVKVCGLVADSYFERTDLQVSKADYYAGQRNTYLYFDKPRGEHDFVAIVHGTVRKDLSKRPESLKGQKLCVSGEIDSYRQRAAIRIRFAEQIEIVGPAKGSSD